MFFFNKKVEAALILAKNQETDRRFSESLAAITEINQMISDTVIKTQAEKTVLLNKLKRHLKHGAKSFTSLSDKLMQGVIVLNYKGEVIQSNPKAHDLLGCDCTNNCIGAHIFDLIKSIKPVSPTGETLILFPTFFEELSSSVFTAALNATPCSPKNYLKTITCALLPDVEQLVDIKTPHFSDVKRMTILFSLLDNDPDELTDVSYVIVFRASKKTDEVLNFTRRLSDKASFTNRGADRRKPQIDD